MVPGDIIEWFHKKSNANAPVNDDEFIPLSQRVADAEFYYAPIGRRSIHVLVSIDETHISWLNANGLFTALRTDVAYSPTRKSSYTVLSRKKM